ncbi:MAG TPA: DinB family protein [Vicinamibacterales bacterium]|nr:DinB family protein [Vicinamibacterales bacterium]
MTNQAFFLHTLSSEFDRFHNVVAALPADRLDYRHDPKSRTAAELIGHLIGHFQDLVELIDDGVIHHRMHVPFRDLPEAIALLDAAAGDTASRMANVSDEAWAQPGDFFVGDRSAIKAPRQALAWLLLLDGIHHRGQLSTLIRPMGGKVPSIYGPSADTAMGG